MIHQIFQLGRGHVIQCQKMPCCHGMALTLVKPWMSINTGEKTGPTSLAVHVCDDNAAGGGLALSQIVVFVEELARRVQWSSRKTGATAQKSATGCSVFNQR